jgi:hypothetical protein
MDQKQADTLLNGLIKNQITRDQLEDLLKGLECPKMAVLIEKSMEQYFLSCMEEEVSPRKEQP